MRQKLPPLSKEAWDILGLSTHPKGFFAAGGHAISAQALKRRGLVRFIQVFEDGKRCDGWQVFITTEGTKELLVHIKAERAAERAEREAKAPLVVSSLIVSRMDFDPEAADGEDPPGWL